MNPSKSGLISLVFIVGCILNIIVVPSVSAAPWQELLEKNFDIVETFDQLRDWYGKIPGGVVDSVDHPEDMPKKLDGSPSIWGTYSQYYTGPNQHLDNWIGVHGADYQWKTGAKNACINYPPLYCEINVDTVKGYGSERLGAYFGNGTPTSGYQEAYVFFMLKFHDGFWALAEGKTDEFKYPPVVKMFDLVSGFDAPTDWHDKACQSNIQHEYGTSFTLFNAGGGGISRPKKLYFLESSAYTADFDTVNSCWRYTGVPGRSGLAYHEEARFDAQYLAHEWIGVEYHLNLGTLNTADGSVEFWVYNDKGIQIGYYAASNILLKRHLDYKYNKTVFGGNYQCAGDTTCPGETRWYFDDLVIDNQRIGPKYFSLISAPDTNKPSPPQALNVR